MRIGIDARKIDDTGIGRYIENLARALLRIDGRNEYVLFLPPGRELDDSYPKGRLTAVVESAGNYSLAEHWSLARKASRYGLDLYHAPHYVLPLLLSRRSVVTAHDIIHLREPSFGAAARAYARFMLGSATRRAERVITVSEHTKRELVEVIGTAEAKIIVIPPGGGDDFTRPAEAAILSALKPLGIPPGYFLFVGSDRPHKNLRAAAGVMRAAPDARFVVAGRVREPSRTMFAGMEERVRFIGQVDKPALAALYSGAAALLFPSYHEGFGLPPLEAMACHTPVVASRRAPIPEVTGAAAALFDPDDHAGMARALLVLRDDAAARAAMVERGIARARQFSWEETARRTLAVYQEALA